MKIQILPKTETQTGTTLGQLLQDVISFEATRRLNAVGTWTLTLPAAAAGHFLSANRTLAPGTGIEVRRHVIGRGVDNPVFSGRAVALERALTQSGDLVTITGESDEALLNDRLAAPNAKLATLGLGSWWAHTPSRRWPHNALGAPITTWTAAQLIAELVAYNVGAQADPARRVPGITTTIIGAPTAAVEPVEVKFQTLGNLIWEIATQTQLVVDILPSAVFGAQVRIRERGQRSVVWDDSRNNLRSMQWSSRRPESTTMVAIATPSGAPSFATTLTDTSDWPRREALLQTPDATTAAALNNAARYALDRGNPGRGITVETIEQPGTLYGVDWEIGDQASVYTSRTGTWVGTDVITEAHMRLADHRWSVIPAIGGAAAEAQRDAFARSWLRLTTQTDQIRRSQW